MKVVPRYVGRSRIQKLAFASNIAITRQDGFKNCTNMNLSLFGILVLVLIPLLAGGVVAQACCLCDECKAAADEKLDLVLLDMPLDQRSCADLAAGLELHESAADNCRNAQQLYSKHCCLEGYDIVLVEDGAATDSEVQVDGLGTKSSSSNKCADNRYASNDITFDTPGGACECPVCESGEEPSGWYGASMIVPGRGQYAGTCSELNQLGT